MNKKSARRRGDGRQRWRAGDVVAVPLGDGTYSFGRVQETPLIAFYDARLTDVPIDLSDVILRPVLFRLWVMEHAVKSGRWRIVGHEAIREPGLLELPRFFHQAIPSGHLSVCLGDFAKAIPATLEEVVGLECAAVWDPEHVEERLRDHFAGRPNKWAESLRPLPPERYGQSKR